jgi:hypothetical protein
MCSGFSTWPKSIVQLLLMPSSCASHAVSSHSLPEHFPLTITSLHSGLKISAPPPGRASKPALFSRSRTSLIVFLVRRAIKKISAGVSAFIETLGNSVFMASHNSQYLILDGNHQQYESQ